MLGYSADSITINSNFKSPKAKSQLQSLIPESPILELGNLNKTKISVTPETSLHKPLTKFNVLNLSDNGHHSNFRPHIQSLDNEHQSVPWETSREKPLNLPYVENHMKNNVENLPVSENKFKYGANKSKSNVFFETVRDKEGRKKLEGFACAECDKFYKAIGMNCSTIKDVYLQNLIFF